MVKAVASPSDGSESTLLRCRAENTDDSSVWMGKNDSILQGEIVEVLRTDATGEVGFAFVRKEGNIHGFVKSEHIKILKCSVHRTDEAESTMLRCRPENSEKNGVWVKGKVCVFPDEEIEVLRVNAAGESGWALVRTHENVEGYLRAAYVGSPADTEEIQDVNNSKNTEKHDILVDEGKQLSRRSSSRIAALPPSSTLDKFFSKAPSKSKSDDVRSPKSSKVSDDINHRREEEEEAIRRSTRVRAPTKFLVKEMSSPSLDKWFQKGDSKPEEDSENGEDGIVEAVTRGIIVDEERPLGDYLMKLRTCAHPSSHALPYLSLTCRISISLFFVTLNLQILNARNCGGRHVAGCLFTFYAMFFFFLPLCV